MICQVKVTDDVAVPLEYALAARDSQGRLRNGVGRLGGPAGRAFDAVVNTFAAHKSLRPTLGLHVGHASLRLSPRDRRLTPNEWREAAGQLASGFGADVWTTVAHGSDHVHVLWSRIRRDGTLVLNHNDRLLAKLITRDIEKFFDLEQVASSPRPGRCAIRNRAQKSDAPEAAHRREAAWAAFKAYKAGGQLLDELEQRSVEVIFNEGIEFCVKLGSDRREKLVSVLVGCARRDGVHPPRERDVLDGLQGMSLDTMKLARPPLPNKLPSPSASPTPVFEQDCPGAEDSLSSSAPSSRQSVPPPTMPQAAAPKPSNPVWLKRRARLKAVLDQRMLNVRDKEARLAKLEQRTLLLRAGTYVRDFLGGQTRRETAAKDLHQALQAKAMIEQELQQLDVAHAFTSTESYVITQQRHPATKPVERIVTCDEHPRMTTADALCPAKTLSSSTTTETNKTRPKSPRNPPGSNRPSEKNSM